MGYGTRSRPRTGGSRWMSLRYAGRCKVCTKPLPAGARAFYDASARTVTCTSLSCAGADGLTKQEWQGSPVSGRWVEVLAEQRLGSGASPDPFAKTRSRGYYGRDAGMCEDAPACGCCD